MKRKQYRVLFTLFAGAGLVLGQQRSASADHPESQKAKPSVKQAQSVKDQADSSTKRTEDDPVRISVTLVQVDAVVTDKHGKLVTDLRFIYAINVPIEKPGGYQLRVAVRDERAGRVGSANQFIDVPDIGMNRLTLSGLVISGFDPSKTKKAAAPGTDQMGQQPPGGQEGAVQGIEPAISPAVRMLRRGIYLDYGFLIYNAQLDPKTGKPQLESQLILLKDGKQVFVGKVSPLNVGEEPDWKHIPAAGRLRLGDELVPGEYVLQMMITDKLAKQKNRSAMQWMDFEITK
jgi:hypothetical protein